MLKAEITRFWAELRFYRQMLIGNTVSFVLVTSGIFFLVSLLGNLSVSSLVALLFWQYASIPLSRLTADIWEECSSGAFEQMYLHTEQPALVLLIRMGIYAVQQTFLAVPVFCLLAVAFRLPWPALASYPWIGLAGVLVLTIAGLSGFGLIVGAILLVYRNAISYASAAEYVLLFVSGAVVPVAQLPQAVQAISPWLPLSLGIETLRRFETGASLQPTLVFLFIQSSLLLAAGLIVFRVSLRRALRHGFGMSR